MRWVTAYISEGSYQLGEEVGRLGHHAGSHAEALNVEQVACQLGGVGMNHHVDQYREEVIRACRRHK